MSQSETEEDEDVQINFVASPSQKARWEEYAGDAGFRSLSEFLRTSAEKEVHGEAGDSGTSEEVTEKLSELMEGLNRMEGRMHDLDNRMAGIESEVREDPEIKQLASEVFAVLPTKQELFDHAKSVEKSGYSPASPATDGTIEGIASELGQEEYMIKDAIDQLQQDTHQVHQTTLIEERQKQNILIEGDDEVRYYKEAK